jgi:uncharacterized membrane protein YadS
MLVPVVLGLGFIYRNAVLESLKMSSAGQGVESLKGAKPTLFPLFLVAFVALVVLSNLSVIPTVAIDYMGDLSALCLLIAMAALGTKTNLIEMWKLGQKPFLLLLLNTLFIGLLAYLLIQ